mgnify:CR=1 FL=1
MSKNKLSRSKKAGFIGMILLSVLGLFISFFLFGLLAGTLITLGYNPEIQPRLALFILAAVSLAGILGGGYIGFNYIPI